MVQADGSGRPFAARRPRQCIHVSLRDPDGFVEAGIGGNVSVIHAHEPTVPAAAPTDSPFFKERCEPPPNSGIVGVSGQGRCRPDMAHINLQGPFSNRFADTKNRLEFNCVKTGIRFSRALLTRIEVVRARARLLEDG